MNLKHLLMAGSLLLGIAALPICVSCVHIDDELGKNLIATNQQYDIYTAEFNLDDVEMKFADSLSGFSSSRIVIGAVRDDEYGLTTRAAAFTLVPVADSLDFGTNPVYRGFHFSAVADSISIPSESERYILQNVNVYELDSPLDYNDYNTNTTSIKHKATRITKGVPVYDGTADSLSFDFSDAFGKKYMKILQSDLDTITDYTSKFPGIYIDMDQPVGDGGRINIFQLALGYSSTYYYLTGNYAELKFTSTYKGERVDTSFLFYYGPLELYNLASKISSSSTFYQYGFNMTGHQTRSMEGKATDKVYIEGGGGLKPVIPASEIRSLVRNEIGTHGDISKAIINKATIEMPFTFPADYSTMFLYPQILSPTVRIQTDTSVAFNGLTDASSSNENQGNIDRSNLDYHPDITHHVQELMQLTDLSKIHNYDVWMLIMANETTKSSDSSSSSSDYSDYYSSLAYSNYYNNLYSGYGGYGYGSGYGYGDYDSYGYSNYYNYMMAAAYASSSSSSSSSTSVAMDKDRYYRACLNGPGASSRRPKLKITYSVPKK